MKENCRKSSNAKGPHSKSGLVKSGSQRLRTHVSRNSSCRVIKRDLLMKLEGLLNKDLMSCMLGSLLMHSESFPVWVKGCKLGQYFLRGISAVDSAYSDHLENWVLTDPSTRGLHCVTLQTLSERISIWRYSCPISELRSNLVWIQETPSTNAYRKCPLIDQSNDHNLLSHLSLNVVVVLRFQIEFPPFKPPPPTKVWLFLEWIDVSPRKPNADCLLLLPVPTSNFIIPSQPVQSFHIWLLCSMATGWKLAVIIKLWLHWMKDTSEAWCKCCSSLDEAI